MAGHGRAVHLGLALLADRVLLRFLLGLAARRHAKRDSKGRTLVVDFASHAVGRLPRRLAFRLVQFPNTAEVRRGLGPSQRKDYECESQTLHDMTIPARRAAADRFGMRL